MLYVAEALKRRGICPRIDMELIPPGRWFQDIIQAAIPTVKSAAVFLGPHGIGKWEVVELRTFISQCVERGMPVIPVLLPGVEDLARTRIRPAGLRSRIGGGASSVAECPTLLDCRDEDA